MSENVSSEHLDLEGPAPTTKSGEGSATQNVNNIHVVVPDLTGLVTPGISNDELVDRLLAAPPEQLITWEECWLPSHGRYYGWPDGMVKVRAMGQTADKVLATERFGQSGQSMDYLFRECVRFPNGFDPLDLLLGDRIFLLYFLRGITHGNQYDFVFTCPNQACGAVSTHQYDLNDLARTVVWAKDGIGVEPFKVELPWLSQALGKKMWVGVRFLRAADANDMLAKRKARKKLLAQPGGVRARPGRGAAGPGQRAQTETLDDTINQNLEKIIVNIMGVGDLFKIREFINKMHSQDTAAIREWLRDNTPGIDNTVSLTCPECNHEFTVELPITESFFRPSKL